jgi:PKD repeat protein
MYRQTHLPTAILGLAAGFLVACGGDGNSPVDPDPPVPPEPPAPNQLPTARFVTSVHDGTAPLTVSFDASASSDPDGTLVSYAWTFGDGSAGAGVQIVHTFTDAGFFQVSLTVRDDRGGSDSAKDSVFTSSPPGSGSNAIEGIVWYDRDLDGGKDADEAGLARFEVFLDANENGERDQGEALTFTDSGGAYAFNGLDGDGGYTVSQALPFGWSNTTPGPLALSPPAWPRAPARIIDGVETPIEPFPFQVALLDGDHQFCGGTLVNSLYVLTAAHCVDDRVGGEFDILIGTNDLVSGGERVGTTAVRTHPSFNSSLDYDVALVRLERPLLRPRVFLQTPDQPSLSLPGDTATVIGWGQTDDGGQPTVLRRVELPIITNALCSEIAGEVYGLIGLRTICAGGRDLGKGPCYGDSGGPLLTYFGSTWSQIGIVSFTAARDRCGDVPGAFSRVSELLAYIISVARIEASGVHVVDWSSGPTARVDFGNFH